MKLNIGKAVRQAGSAQQINNIVRDTLINNNETSQANRNTQVFSRDAYILAERHDMIEEIFIIYLMEKRIS